MQELETKLFDIKPRAYRNFRTLDVDNDGYISYKDLEHALANQKIKATQQEVVDLMTHVLDPERKGFIGLPEYTKRFG